MEYMEGYDVSKFYTFTTVETYFFVPEPLWNSDNQKLQNFKIDFLTVVWHNRLPYNYFCYRLVLIAQRKISV